MRSMLLMVTAVIAVLTADGLLIANDCVTPDDVNGICLPIDTCPPLLALVSRNMTEATRQHLRRSQCPGYVQNKPRVCCPPSAALSGQRVNPQAHVIVDHPNLHLINAPGCGEGETSRIFHGRNVDMYEFPWMALLGYRDGRRGAVRFSCTGSLINNRYILTAAKCINSSLFMVRLGEHTIGVDPDCEVLFGGHLCASSSQNFSVERSIVHPGYARSSYANNIALIRLNTSAEFTDSVKPICLPVGAVEQDSNLVGKRMIVSGWGIELNGSASSSTPLKDSVSIMHHGTCHEHYTGEGLVVSELALCADAKSGSSHDACSADPGSPLVALTRAAGHVQYGVASQAGAWCSGSQAPAIFTRVGHYVRWILDNIQP